MGLAMATNIQNHLKEKEFTLLKYFNRTISKGEELKEGGGTPSPSIEELVQGCDVIFISVRSLPNT